MLEQQSEQQRQRTGRCAAGTKHVVAHRATGPSTGGRKPYAAWAARSRSSAQRRSPTTRRRGAARRSGGRRSFVVASSDRVTEHGLGVGEQLRDRPGQAGERVTDLVAVTSRRTGDDGLAAGVQSILDQVGFGCRGTSGAVLRGQGEVADEASVARIGTCGSEGIARPQPGSPSRRRAERTAVRHRRQWARSRG